MTLSFDNKKIRATCEDRDLADTELGHALATCLRSRLADLEASPNVSEMPTGNAKQIEGDYACYKVDLIDNYRLVFCTAQNKMPQKDGNIDWKEVTRIKILKIDNV